MILTDFTEKQILNIKNINLPNNVIFKNDYIDDLYNISKSILKYVINNIKIKTILERKLNPKNVKNISYEILLKINSKSILDQETRKFIKKFQSGKLKKKNVEKYINYNSKKISSIVYNNIHLLDNYSMQLLNIYSKNILSQFIPMNIQEDIIINLKNNIEYSVTLDNININFSFFYKDSLESNKILIIFVKALYLIKLFGFKNAKINIMCFLSNIKKEFSNEKFLGSNEVNSGLTSFDINGNNIIIYRLEEIEKVVLHELVHSLEIDNKVMNNLDKIHDLIKCNFSINNDSSINFFESFTNLLL